MGESNPRDVIAQALHPDRTRTRWARSADDEAKEVLRYLADAGYLVVREPTDEDIARAAEAVYEVYVKPLSWTYGDLARVALNAWLAPYRPGGER